LKKKWSKTQKPKNLNFEVSIGKVQNFPKEGRDKKKRVELGE